MRDHRLQPGSLIYPSYADFYHAAYGSFITRTASLGPITLLDLNQTAGDFSDAATRDITIQRVLSRASVHADFGAGRFSKWGSRGDFGLGAAGSASTILVDQPHRIDVISLPWETLLAADVNGELPADGHLGPAHAGCIRDMEMYALFDRLWSIQDGDEQSLEVDTAILWITRRLLDWAARPPRNDPVEKLSARSLALVKDRLDAPGAPSVALSELAALCRLSPHHLCRAFKAATGLPPHRWQVVRRIERARTLLTGTTLPVAEVASAVGYDDPAYFSRLFAKETGHSPRAWRAEGVHDHR